MYHICLNISKWQNDQNIKYKGTKRSTKYYTWNGKITQHEVKPVVISCAPEVLVIKEGEIEII